MKNVQIEALRQLPSKDKSYRHSIESVAGLSLFIYPDKGDVKGKREFVFRYSISGKRISAMLGNLDDFTQKDLGVMINQIEDWRGLIKKGVDPQKLSKQQKENPYFGLENIEFGEACDLWVKYRMSKQLQNGKTFSDSTVEHWRRVLGYIKDQIGDYKLDDITPSGLLMALERIQESNTLNVGKDCRMYTEKVFQFAQIFGLTNNNPAVILKGQLATKPVRHLPALVDEEDFFRLLVTMRNFNDCHPITHHALNILPYVFVRNADLRNWQWQDVDFENKQWIFSPKKQSQDNSVESLIVPLAEPVLKRLELVRAYSYDSPFVFPSPRNKRKPIGETTLIDNLYRMGFKGEQTVHGFRACAKTLLMEHDDLRYSSEITEIQLGHVTTDRYGKAYNRVKDIKRRTQMMEDWALFIDNKCREKEAIYLDE